MQHVCDFVELDDATGERRYLWRAKRFADAYPHLAGSYIALRKRIERRALNGLLAAGAVCERRAGLLIDAGRYRAWVLEPCTRRESAEVAA